LTKNIEQNEWSAPRVALAVGVVVPHEKDELLSAAVKAQVCLLFFLSLLKAESLMAVERGKKEGEQQGRERVRVQDDIPLNIQSL